MYPAKSRLKAATEWFPIAAAQLSPRPSHSELARMIGPRANVETVKQWRLGYRGAPQWAVDRLSAILQAQTERQLEIIAKAAASSRGNGGDIGTIALRNWRRQRALEREKAPNQGRLSET